MAPTSCYDVYFHCMGHTTNLSVFTLAIDTIELDRVSKSESESKSMCLTRNSLISLNQCIYGLVSLTRVPVIAPTGSYYVSTLTKPHARSHYLGFSKHQKGWGSSNKHQIEEAGVSRSRHFTLPPSHLSRDLDPLPYVWAGREIRGHSYLQVFVIQTTLKETYNY